MIFNNVSKPNSSLPVQNPSIGSTGISISGYNFTRHQLLFWELIANEFIFLTPGRGLFDWNDNSIGL